jgi:membrane-associated phospholipid phosphatase
MKRRTIVFPEVAFVGVGSAVTAALLLHSCAEFSEISLRVAVFSFVCLVAYWIAVYRSEFDGLVRLAVNYLAVWLLYSGSGPVIEALQRTDRGELLLAWDRRLFGESPAVAFQAMVPPWINEILSAGYLSYHIYLHWIIWHVVCLPQDQRQRYTRPLFTALAMGFSLYFLMPAAGIGNKFPELFDEPIKGYWLTSVVEAIVENLAATYDSFPSMHIFVTGVMLACDSVNCRRRFWIMLPPSVLMVAATVLLRLHYAVDLLVSIILLIPFVYLFVGRNSQ